MALNTVHHAAPDRFSPLIVDNLIQVKKAVVYLL